MSDQPGRTPSRWESPDQWVEYRVKCANGMGPTGVHEQGHVSCDAEGIQITGPEPLAFYDDGHWRCGPHTIERRVVTVTPWFTNAEQDS